MSLIDFFGGGDSDNQLMQLLMQSQMSPFQSLVSSIPAYNYSKKAGRYMQPAQDIAAAYGNMDNPMYQKIYGQQKQAGQQNIAEVIAEMQRQNRKSSAMGRTPLFSQERGGEQQFRGLVQGYQDAQNNAMGQTNDILGNMYTQQAQLGTANAANAAKRSSVKGNVYGALAKVFGL